MLAQLVLYRCNASALEGARDDRAGSAGGVLRFRVRPVDGRDVVPVDDDGMPAEGRHARGIRIEIVAEHRLPGLSEAIDVDDGCQVVQATPAGVLEGFPHRPLGHLGVAAQHPHPVREFVEFLGGQGDSDADGKALTQRSRRDVGRGHPWGRVPFESAVEPSVGAELRLVDRAGRMQHRVVEG